MNNFLDTVKTCIGFENCITMNDFESKYKELFKRKCGKCKKEHYLSEYSINSKNELFKLCNLCKNAMKMIMRNKKIKIE